MASAARVAAIAAKLTTGNIARVALGQSLTDLSGAYAKVQAFNPAGPMGLSAADTWAGFLVGLDPWNIPAAYQASGKTGSAQTISEATTDYLDGIRTRAESDFAALPATDDPLDSSVASQTAFDIGSIETATGVTATTLPQSALQDLTDQVTQSVRDIVPSLAKPLLGAIPWYAYAIVMAVAIVLFLGLWKKRA
jgi:hypothetical protein